VIGQAVIEEMFDAADGSMNNDKQDDRKEGQDSKALHPAGSPGVWL
jgi:hypothetical protein